MPETIERISRPIVDWPGYWFLLLEHYLTDGELEAAAEAQRQLERLGVDVRYRQRSTPTRQETRQ
jgi:hypothetical protein